MIDQSDSIENKALKKAGLKITSPRLKILKLLKVPSLQHASAEDIHHKLLAQKSDIGLATIYRVLNQFDDAGIVTRHQFEAGRSVFELSNKEHHDHLICLKCGEVIEFNDDLIEEQQKLIAERYGITLSNHSLFLYGKPINGQCNHKKYKPHKNIS